MRHIFLYDHGVYTYISLYCKEDSCPLSRGVIVNVLSYFFILVNEIFCSIWSWCLLFIAKRIGCPLPRGKIKGMVNVLFAFKAFLHCDPGRCDFCSVLIFLFMHKFLMVRFGLSLISFFQLGCMKPFLCFHHGQCFGHVLFHSFLDILAMVILHIFSSDYFFFFNPSIHS